MNIRMNVYVATLPVAEDGPLAKPTPHRVTIMAADWDTAMKQAADAGLTFEGQLLVDGTIRKENVKS